MSEPRRERADEPRDPAPAIRASDAEREQVAEIVRRAVGDGRLTLVEGDERLAGVYACVHRGELVPFTADLGETAPEPAPAPWYRADAPVPARPATTTSVAVMSGATRRGEWTPGRRHVAVAVMGGVELRLRDARLGAEGLELDVIAIMGGAEVDLRGADLRGGVTIRALALMGGVEVIVDPDTRVEEHGVGLMGGFDDESGAPARADGPVVRVTGLAMMGGVSVQRRRTGIDDRGRPEGVEGSRDDDRGPRGLHGGH
jgi:hypothetical protein